ncbi:MAG: acyl-CoA thioesterase domain-containing protein [Hyalangium sp.]|uniref:acyl-CoA thioesterase domain-containing protein n=1 Tax=Hyalangium sp. TaxID=2028555 RepID=UPI00389A264B
MSAPFLTAIHLAPLGEGRYRSRFEAPWYQGRGAFGGVVAGQLLRAMEHLVADPGRPVRSLTVHFCAPAAQGEAEVRGRIERAGKLVSVLSAVEGLHPVASVDFTVHFFHALPRPADRPGAHYLRTGCSRWAGEGFTEDFQELWTEEGELLAQCRQCIAVLG